ncbi:Ig-like domain-containing protein [Flavobacterium sp. 3HN19-14]|uniref:Ig-like domain-containing protein n=1 Tax=Flavobacterium sp. 3HN19-14 TaxID=3448133 RepID=UPI003EDF9CEB
MEITSQATNGIASVFANDNANDPSDDTVLYTPNAGFSGIDTFTYTITDALGNTATATVTVVVASFPNSVLVVGEDHGSVSQFVTGNTVIENILANDTLDGVAASLSTVTITQLSTTNQYFNIDTATGAAILNPGTPTQHYVIEYQICEIAHPENCAVGKVALLNAANQSDNFYAYASVCGDSYVSEDILANDSYYGMPVHANTYYNNNNNIIDNVSIQFNYDGANISYNDGNTYIFANYITNGMVTYTICDLANPQICDYGQFPLWIAEAYVNANDDNFSVYGVTGGTVGNILSNDTTCGYPGFPGSALDISYQFARRHYR